MPTTAVPGPTTAPEPHQDTPAISAPTGPEAVNNLWAELAAGRIAMTDLLTRLAEMQAAFLGV